MKSWETELTGEFFFQKPPPYGSPEWDQWWEDFNQHWDDLSCDETLDASDEEEERPRKRRRGPRTPPDSQSTPPKTQQYPTNIPECLLQFVSSAVYSNKTHNAFLVYTTREKGAILYYKLINKFKVMFASEHFYKLHSLVLIICGGKHRVSAIYNFCKHNCTVSFVIAKAVIKPYECYYAMLKDDFLLSQQTNAEGLKGEEFCTDEGKEKSLDWKKLCEFACAIECEDALLLMGYYIHFSYPIPACKHCNKGDKLHLTYHEQHHENAKLFVNSKSQRNSCQQACEWVMAENRLLTRTASREEIMVSKFKKMLKKMQDIAGETAILEFMAGVAWLSQLHEHFDELIVDLIRLIVENTPKKRNALFVGPFNSGKTTVAACIMDLLGGIPLNINCAPDKLTFEVGCAIDKFLVVLEDVKGSSKNDLLPGPGVSNLDNMRDFLDGAVAVNLERKHCNKHSQIFPPCIMTMNEYDLPYSLQTRFVKKVHFTHKPHLRRSLDKNEDINKKRICQRGETLLLCLMWWQPLSAFHEEIREDVKMWKETMANYCSITEFNKMVINIQNGDDPLAGLLEYETLTEEDSGFSGTPI